MVFGLIFVSAVSVQVSWLDRPLATVNLNRIGGTIPLTGKLIFADDTTLRIAVEASGNATASGEIQIGYSGRNLRSVSATNLVLDGQNVTLRF